MPSMDGRTVSDASVSSAPKLGRGWGGSAASDSSASGARVSSSCSSSRSTSATSKSSSRASSSILSSASAGGRSSPTSSSDAATLPCNRADFALEPFLPVPDFGPAFLAGVFAETDFFLPFSGFFDSFFVSFFAAFFRAFFTFAMVAPVYNPPNCTLSSGLNSIPHFFVRVWVKMRIFYSHGLRSGGSR